MISAITELLPAASTAQLTSSATIVAVVVSLPQPRSASRPATDAAVAPTTPTSPNRPMTAFP